MHYRFYLAAILTAVPMIGFVFAVISRPLYRGTLRDANGMPPIRAHILSRIWELEGNAVAVAVGLVVLVIAVWFFRLGV